MRLEPIPRSSQRRSPLNLVIGTGMECPCLHDSATPSTPTAVVTAEFPRRRSGRPVGVRPGPLAGGYKRPVGDGDVTCWPATVTGERWCVSPLRSPSGQALRKPLPTRSRHS